MTFKTLLLTTVLGIYLSGCAANVNKDFNNISQKVKSIAIVEFNVSGTLATIYGGPKGKFGEEFPKPLTVTLNKDSQTFLQDITNKSYTIFTSIPRFNIENEPTVVANKYYSSLKKTNPLLVNYKNLGIIDKNYAKQLCNELNVDAVAFVKVRLRNGITKAVWPLFPAKSFADAVINVQLIDNQGKTLLDYTGVVEGNIITDAKKISPVFNVNSENSEHLTNAANQFINALEKMISSIKS